MGRCTFHLGNKRKKITFNFVYGNKFHNKEKIRWQKGKSVKICAICAYVEKRDLKLYVLHNSQDEQKAYRSQESVAT